MTVDYWNSSQAEDWVCKDFKNCCRENEHLVYIIYAIDTLADLLPKFVRNSLLHYTAMVYAHRYVCVTTGALDGERCCEIVSLALSLAIEAEGKSVPQSVWDSAVAKVFPCEVVHRATLSAADLGKGAFLEKLNFDLYVYHPFETLALLLAEFGDRLPYQVASVAIGAINSLYRTPTIVDQPPFLIAVAALAAALLLTPGMHNEDVEKFIARLPVDSSAVERIVCTDLFNFLKNQEIPLPQPPAVVDLPSPSGRTGRTVSRQSSRSAGASSGRSKSSSTRKRATATVNEGLASLSWALLPSLAGDDSSHSTRSSQRRAVALPELRILREISRCCPPAGLIRLVDAKLYSPAEQSLFRSSGVYVISGAFDAIGNQFDSVARLVTGHMQLLKVIEQLLQAVLFLNEFKICHYSIEPKNIMVSGDCVKIASLSTATVLPSIPSTLPSHCYRAPELLLGNAPGAREDPLAADLWSLGCVIAEIARIFATRNRYEEPLFRITDSLPDKVPAKCPVTDAAVYTNCRYFVRITECINKGDLPSAEVWPGFKGRANSNALNDFIAFKKAKYPDRNAFGSNGEDLRAYLKDKDGEEGVVTEVVKALLRWSPEKRTNPRVCLARLIKLRST